MNSTCGTSFEKADCVWLDFCVVLPVTKPSHYGDAPMSKKQATVAAIILEYIPMASPEVAAELSEKIVAALGQDKPRLVQPRLKGGSQPDN